MKKNIARGSMLAVAAISLMLGGTSYTSTSSVKKQVSETPAIIGKAIGNSAIIDIKELAKGITVQDVAQVVEQQDSEEVTAEAPAEEVSTVQVEEKEAKVESNQVVANIDSYLNIRSEPSEEGEVVGKFYTGNVGTIVEKGEEWSVVASGNAYGYVKNDYLLFGETAEEYIANNCDQIAKVTAETLNVRAEESTESDIVTLSGEGDTLTILGQEDGWVKVAVTDDQIGYVSSDYVYLDYVYETAVTIEEEEATLAAMNNTLTEEIPATVPPTTEAQVQTPATEAPAPVPVPATEAPEKEENKTEPVESSSGNTDTGSVSGTGQDVANYAVQFVGNPYKYGGTSLTNGADCSGFVQAVYKHFGYSLSRTAASQAGDGTAVSVDSLQAGDLLFYHGFGHVAIYIGGGQVVHASNVETGIKISNYDYSTIDKAVRIIK